MSLLVIALEIFFPIVDQPEQSFVFYQNIPIADMGSRYGVKSLLVSQHATLYSPENHSHSKVKMRPQRRFPNMACSRGRGPANRLAGMVRILLPELRGSRKRKEPSGSRPPTNTTSAEGAPDARGM